MVSSKTFFTILLSCFATIWIIACSEDNLFNSDLVPDTNFTQAENFSFNSAVSNQEKIIVSAINGGITVRPSHNSEIQIIGQKKVSSYSDADALNFLEKLRVIYEPSGNSVFLSVNQTAESKGRNLRVDFLILIPDSFNIEISQENGEVLLDSINSKSIINLTNGKVDFNNYKGSVVAEVVNGNTQGNIDLAVNGECLIKIVNGSLDLNFPLVTSAIFNARITNGTIGVSNLNLQNMVSSQKLISGILGNGQGKINLEVVNGIIEVDGY
jgi:hypothetical protein